jgi:hypothetical protein
VNAQVAFQFESGAMHEGNVDAPRQRGPGNKDSMMSHFIIDPISSGGVGCRALKWTVGLHHVPTRPRYQL